MKHLLIALTLGLTVPAFAADQILDSYIKIQEALAKDSLNEARKFGSLLSREAKSDSVKRPAQEIAKAKSIEAVRESFKQLSVIISEQVQKENLRGFEVIHCPMAKAKWVQEKGEVQNPYYGKEMASCGERVQ